MTRGQTVIRARLLLAVALLALAQTAFAQSDSSPRPAELIDPDGNRSAPLVYPAQPVAPPNAATPNSALPPGFVPMPPPAAGYSPSSLPTPPPYAPPASSSFSAPYAPSQSSPAPSLSAPYAPRLPSYLPEPYGPPSPAVASAIVTPASDYWTDRFWFSTDYLMWWTRAGTAPPLITSGSPGSFIPGALGERGTHVLFGGSSLDPGMFSGLRLNGGFWITDTLGIDASFFSLFQRSIGFDASSNQNGYPLIARPVYDALSGTESSYVDSYPGVAVGDSNAVFSSMLRGFEMNLAIKAFRDEGLSVDGFVGYRQLNLNESLVVQDSIAALQSGYLTFLGGPADPPSSLTDFDSFTTSSNFYGGQVGGRMNWNFNRLNFNILGKLALGVSQQIATVNGATTLYAPGAAPVTAPGGILAQTTNIGRYFSDQFAVVPEIGLNFGYQVTPWMQVKFGYNFLFWSSVARPGQQIDRRVNGNNVPSDASYGGTGGPAVPAFTFIHTDYWAQGLNLGLEFRR